LPVSPTTLDELQQLEPTPELSVSAEPAAIPTAEPAPLAPAAAGVDLLQRLQAQLLALLAASPLRSLDDLLAAARILGLALLAGIALRLTGATLGALNDVPLLGGLLELVGLLSLLRFLARHALRQQKRAELLDRIRQLRRQLLG
jgi:hypothetical protein